MSKEITRCSFHWRESRLLLLGGGHPMPNSRNGIGYLPRLPLNAWFIGARPEL